MATTHTVSVGVGTDRVTLGSKRTLVRERFGECRTIRRAGGSRETDQFVAEGVMVTYDGHDRVEEIEITPPALVLLGRCQLLGLSLEAAVDALIEEGLLPTSDGEEYVEVPDCGLSLFCVDRIVDAVWVGMPSQREESNQPSFAPSSGPRP